MIQDCRIYTPDGKLKETLSGEYLAQKYWEGVLGEETPHSRIHRLRSVPRATPTETKKMHRAVVRFLRDNPVPSGRWGFTAGDIMKGLKFDAKDYNRSYQRLKTVLRRAESKEVDGYRIRKTHQAGCQNRYEYYLQEVR